MRESKRSAHSEATQAILATDAAAQLRRATTLLPRLAVVLGSGFAAVAKAVRAEVELPYFELPGFVCPRVRGHLGRVLVGCCGEVPVLVLQGRAHYYEGYSMAEVTFPMRVLVAFGVRAVLLTNAAGGISRALRPGDFMCVADHINCMGENPLRGLHLDGRTIFVDLSRIYDPALCALAQRAARRHRLRLRCGVYAAMSGPSYETPAEVRALAHLGADAVGMSTVPEAIMAHGLGLRVCAISCITNRACGLGRSSLSHREVLEGAARVEDQAICLVGAFAQLFDQHAEEQ